MLVMVAIVPVTYVLLLSARGVTTNVCQYARDMRDGACDGRTVQA